MASRHKSVSDRRISWVVAKIIKGGGISECVPFDITLNGYTGASVENSHEPLLHLNCTPSSIKSLLDLHGIKILDSTDKYRYINADKSTVFVLELPPILTWGSIQSIYKSLSIFPVYKLDIGIVFASSSNPQPYSFLRIYPRKRNSSLHTATLTTPLVQSKRTFKHTNRKRGKRGI